MNNHIGENSENAALQLQISKTKWSSLMHMLFSPTSSLLQQFARYLLVGGGAFAIDFSALYLLTEFIGFHYLVSAAISFLLGLITNYWLSRLWVFNQRSVKNITVEFAIFAFIGIVGLGLNEGIIWFIAEKVHFHYMTAKAISAAIVLVWNFGARKLVLFR
jgi:putative flippase GtrA